MLLVLDLFDILYTILSKIGCTDAGGTIQNPGKTGGKNGWSEKNAFLPGLTGNVDAESKYVKYILVIKIKDPAASKGVSSLQGCLARYPRK